MGVLVATDRPAGLAIETVQAVETRRTRTRCTVDRDWPCRRRCGRGPSAVTGAGTRCDLPREPGCGLAAGAPRDGPPGRRGRTHTSGSTTSTRTAERHPWLRPRGPSASRHRCADRGAVAQRASGERYGATSRPPGVVRLRHLHTYARRSSRWWTLSASPMSRVGTPRAGAGNAAAVGAMAVLPCDSRSSCPPVEVVVAGNGLTGRLHRGCRSSVPTMKTPVLGDVAERRHPGIGVPRVEVK